MKILKIAVLSFLPLFGLVNQIELSIDANGDGLKDVLTYEIKDLHKYPNLNEPTISMVIKTKNKSYTFDTYYLAYPSILSCGSGCILIHDVRGGYSGVDEKRYYRFDKKRDYWFLDDTVNVEEKDLISLLPTIKKLYKQKAFKGIKALIQNIKIDNIEMSKNTITQYNDIAYYLEKAGAYKEAVVILEQVLNFDNRRKVAYLNSADAYWKLGKKYEAKEAYKRYADLMRRKGKEKRIPKRVLTLLKENSIAQFIPKGSTFLKLEIGDLNRDSLTDAILVYEKENGDRPLLILIGKKNHSYELKAKNKNIVYHLEDGGARGDPFQGVTIKNGYFSVEHEGGSRELWTNIITFKYNDKKRAWFLHKEGGSTFDTRSGNGLVEEVKDNVDTVKDFGVIPFEKYNNRSDD